MTMGRLLAQPCGRCTVVSHEQHASRAVPVRPRGAPRSRTRRARSTARRRCRSRRPARAGRRDVAARAARSHGTRRGSRTTQPVGAAAGSASPRKRRAPAPRRPAGISSPNSGCTRFTIRAATVCDVFGQPFGEELGLVDRVAPRRRHQHERRRRIGKQFLDGHGPRPKAFFHALRRHGRTRRRLRSPPSRRLVRRYEGTSAPRRSRRASPRASAPSGAGRCGCRAAA